MHTHIHKHTHILKHPTTSSVVHQLFHSSSRVDELCECIYDCSCSTGVPNWAGMRRFDYPMSSTGWWSSDTPLPYSWSPVETLIPHNIMIFLCCQGHGILPLLWFYGCYPPPLGYWNQCCQDCHFLGGGTQPEFPPSRYCGRQGCLGSFDNFLVYYAHPYGGFGLVGPTLSGSLTQEGKVLL